MALSLLVGCASPDRIAPAAAEPVDATEAEPVDEVSEDEARAELRTRCEARCGTIFDRDGFVRRIASAGPLSAEEQDLLEGHGVATTAGDPERFRSFAEGGPAVIVWTGYTIDLNPERVELDGRSGTAIFIDGENRVVACMSSDPDLLPRAVRVDC